MPRARALVAAVPQRVWAAVAGLVLLASLGVTLVLAAGLSTWQGAVGHSPDKGVAQPPGSVVIPPGSAVIVVPTPHAHRPAPGTPPHPSGTGPVAVATPVASPPVAAPVAAPVVLPSPAPVPSTPVAPPVTAGPRITHGSGDTAPGKSKHVHKVKHAKHGNRGKHLGWFKNNVGKHG